MKNLLTIFFLLISASLFSQSKFEIQGKTNVLVNGKAWLSRLTPEQWYPLKTKIDTVPVRNHFFVFKGVLNILKLTGYIYLISMVKP